MKIVLLRHGKPDIPNLGKLKASEFHRWIEAYNSAPLDTELKPSLKLIEIANQCNIIVCSDLPRSIESAKILGVEDIHCIDAIYREFELPYARELPKHGSPKLSPAVWSILFRVFWFMGYAPNCESLSSARQRASSAAHLLHNKAVKNKTVLFVGHSLLNSFIAKTLLAKGWRGTTSIFSKHWEFSVFENMES